MSYSWKKRKRRRLRALALLILTPLLVLSVAFGARRAQVAEEIASVREAAMRAQEREQAREALELWTRYLRRRPHDVEAQYAYARTRRAVESPRGEHYAAAIDALRRALEIQPDHDPSQRLLLTLLYESGKLEAAVDGADAWLARHPNDASVLRLRADALDALGRSGEALQTYFRLAEAAPTDLEARGRLMLAMRESGAREAELLAQARTFPRDASELETRFASAFLAGLARRLADRPDAAKADFRRAAELSSRDPERIRLLVSQLDGLLMFDASRFALRRGMEAGHEQLRKPLVRRLWWSGRVDAVREATEGARDADLLAYRWLATQPRRELSDRTPAQNRGPVDPRRAGATGRHTLTEAPPETSTRSASADGGERLERAEAVRARVAAADPRTDSGAKAKAKADAEMEASRTLARLRTATPSSRAEAWLAVFESPPASPQRVRALDAALARIPHEPVLHAMLARTWRRLGEVDLALNACREAAVHAPVWARPYREAAEAAIALERFSFAEQLARAAVQRDRADPANRHALAHALLRKPGESAPSRQAARRLLDTLALNARSLPAHLAWLQDRPGEAREAIERYLDQPPPQREKSVLLAFAWLSHEKALPQALTQECLDAARRQFGATPSWAFIAARVRDDPAEGLKLMERIVRQLAEDDDRRWKQAAARYLAEVDDPRAESVWIRLADRYPADLEIQRRALWQLLDSAQALDEAHIDAAERLIVRLRSRTTERGLSWRLARAKLLIKQPPELERLADAAVELNRILRHAPECGEARRLLDRCLVRLDEAEPSPDSAPQPSAKPATVTNAPPARAGPGT